MKYFLFILRLALFVPSAILLAVFMREPIIDTVEWIVDIERRRL